MKMEGSNKSVGGSADKCLTKYKFIRTLHLKHFGRVILAEHVLTGEKVAIYITTCGWIENTKEKGMHHLHITKNQRQIFKQYNFLCIDRFKNMICIYMNYEN